MNRNAKLAGLVGAAGILVVCAVPLLAGQEPGRVSRPSALLKAGILSNTVSVDPAAAQRISSGGAVGFLSLEGTRTGIFKTSLPGNRIPITKFDYEIISPRDSATGQASGKRQHKPIRIVKEWDANTPMLFQALVTNEQIKTAKFEFVKPNPRTGEEYVYHTIILTNAAISNLRQFAGDQAQPTAARTSRDTMELEEISFTFQKIDISNLDGKTAAGDDFSPIR